LIVLVAAGCGQAGSPGGQPSSTVVSSGSATPAATGTASTTGPSQPPVPSGATAQVWQLRYLLLGHYPNFAYCDPDLYPVARDDEQGAADDWWAGADRGSPEVETILAHRGYREPLMTAQRLTVYRDHKKLNVIVMRAASGGYEYELSASVSGGEPDLTIAGLITLDGTIHERSRRPRAGGCPICLEADTRIATPRGDVPVARIRPGDVVWTVDANGRRVTSPVEWVVRRPTPGPHLMLRLALSDGRVLVAAGVHPAADGTYLRQLRLGQRYDGATVTTIGWTQSTTLATFDLLPAGPTGDYWANGILVGSTLRT
jgi:hypothetical protein